MNQPVNQRLGSREHEWHRFKKTAQFCRIILDLGFLCDIGSVKRYDAWFIPLLDERKQVDAGVAKINMHKICAMPLQQ
jgi:hypothetical protein